MPVLFKDFDKETQDFFNKYYVKGTNGFKLEQKAKGGNQEVYVNPVFEKGVLTANFHYDDKAYKLKTKIGVANNNTIVPKVTYENGEHKFEVTDTFKLLNLADWAGELVHEWKAAAFSVNSKSKFGAGAKCTSDIGLAVGITSDISAGGQVSVNLCDYTLSAYKAGLRFQCCAKNILAATYDQTGAIGVAFIGGLKDVAGFPLDYSANVNYTAKGTAIALGLQTQCPISGSTVRTKADLAGNYGLAFIKKFAHGTTATLGLEGSYKSLNCPLEKLAVSVTREQ